eukprot:Rhum_TRINITY_DN9574_c0_g1::Rhum_TRINITY_DN9574_c0_g1_i1::g.34118::m.34118
MPVPRGTARKPKLPAHEAEAMQSRLRETQRLQNFFGTGTGNEAEPPPPDRDPFSLQDLLNPYDQHRSAQELVQQQALLHPHQQPSAASPSGGGGLQPSSSPPLPRPRAARARRTLSSERRERKTQQRSRSKDRKRAMNDNLAATVAANLAALQSAAHHPHPRPPPEDENLPPAVNLWLQHCNLPDPSAAPAGVANAEAAAAVYGGGGGGGCSAGALPDEGDDFVAFPSVPSQPTSFGAHSSVRTLVPKGRGVSSEPTCHHPAAGGAAPPTTTSMLLVQLHEQMLAMQGAADSCPPAATSPAGGAASVGVSPSKITHRMERYAQKGAGAAADRAMSSFSPPIARHGAVSPGQSPGCRSVEYAEYDRSPKPLQLGDGDCGDGDGDADFGDRMHAHTLPGGAGGGSSARHVLSPPSSSVPPASAPLPEDDGGGGGRASSVMTFLHRTMEAQRTSCDLTQKVRMLTDQLEGLQNLVSAEREAAAKGAKEVAALREENRALTSQNRALHETVEKCNEEVSATLRKTGEEMAQQWQQDKDQQIKINEQAKLLHKVSEQSCEAQRELRRLSGTISGLRTKLREKDETLAEKDDKIASLEALLQAARRQSSVASTVELPPPPPPPSSSTTQRRRESTTTAAPPPTPPSTPPQAQQYPSAHTDAVRQHQPAPQQENHRPQHQHQHPPQEQQLQEQQHHSHHQHHHQLPPRAPVSAPEPCLQTSYAEASLRVESSAPVAVYSMPSACTSDAPDPPAPSVPHDAAGGTQAAGAWEEVATEAFEARLQRLEQHLQPASAPSQPQPQPAERTQVQQDTTLEDLLPFDVSPLRAPQRRRHSTPVVSAEGVNGNEPASHAQRRPRPSSCVTGLDVAPSGVEQHQRRRHSGAASAGDVPSAGALHDGFPTQQHSHPAAPPPSHCSSTPSALVQPPAPAAPLDKPERRTPDKPSRIPKKSTPNRGMGTAFLIT